MTEVSELTFTMAAFGLADFRNHLIATVENPDFAYEQVFGIVSAETGMLLVFMFENMDNAFSVPVSVETYKKFQPYFTHPGNVENLSIYG